MFLRKNLIFLGPPGAGKGTFAKMLIKDMDIPHISTGDILRAEIKNETPLGLKAKECVESGQLVSDELVTDMVVSRLSQSDCANGFILDGFPRTINQANLLTTALSESDKKLDAIVSFECEDELLLKRLTSRIMCRKCGRSYNKLFAPPKVEGQCDDCGKEGEIYQREDDSLETAKDRLKVYEEQTAPLIEYYKESGYFVALGCDRSMDDIYADLKSALM
jgi:adenylate kinase